MKLPVRVSRILSLYWQVGYEPMHWEVLPPEPGTEAECLRQLYIGAKALPVFAVGSELPPAAQLFTAGHLRVLRDIKEVEGLCSEAYGRVDFARAVVERIQRRAYARQQTEQYLDLRIALRELSKARELLRRDYEFDTVEDWVAFENGFEPEPDPDPEEGG